MAFMANSRRIDREQMLARRKKLERSRGRGRKVWVVQLRINPPRKGAGVGRISGQRDVRLFFRRRIRNSFLCPTPTCSPTSKPYMGFQRLFITFFQCISIRYNWICLFVLMKPIFRSIFGSQLRCVGFQHDNLIFRELFIFTGMSNLLLNSPQFIFLFINSLPFDRCFIRITRTDWRLLIFKQHTYRKLLIKK